MSDNPYVALALVFVPLSLVSLGGGMSVLPAIQHQVVDVHHWASAREFVDLFAVARTAPGPGSMLVTLVGWKVAGWTGALVATLAMFLPCALLCLLVARTWSKHKGKTWHSVLEEGLAPVGTGLICASAIGLIRISNAGLGSLLVAGATAALLILRPRLPTYVPLAAGAALFAAWRVL